MLICEENFNRLDGRHFPLHGVTVAPGTKSSVESSVAGPILVRKLREERLNPFEATLRTLLES